MTISLSHISAKISKYQLPLIKIYLLLDFSFTLFYRPLCVPFLTDASIFSKSIISLVISMPIFHYSTTSSFPHLYLWCWIVWNKIMPQTTFTLSNFNPMVINILFFSCMLHCPMMCLSVDSSIPFHRLQTFNSIFLSKMPGLLPSPPLHHYLKFFSLS